MAGELATDHQIAALARAQYGVAARAQLVELGLTRNEIERRVTAGRLHPIHRGVYAVGHVTVPGDPGRARRRGLKVHRSRTLTPDDVTELDRIRVTEPHRTITDLARTTHGRPLERAVNLAESLVDFDRLRRTGPPSLQAVLRTYTTALTRSKLEEMFLQLCDDHDIARPAVNNRVEGIECDFVWRDARLVVEVDGYKYHRAPSVFESDRAKDVELEIRGWRVLRFTWRQVERRPQWVARAIRLAWRSP